MGSAPVLLLSLLAGCVLGGIFFGGLWWTVRRGLVSKRPALWFFGSLFARLALVLFGFYVVGAGHWERMLACLLGFLLGRLLVLRLTRPLPPRAGGAAKEIRDAP